jgi:hypothetical protein
MIAVKILERKAVIRFFGLALILAPFMNILLMLYMIKTQSQLNWSALPYQKIFMSGKIANYMLILASVVIGAIMLSGSKKAWKFTLILIGTHVLLQIPSIGQDIRQNWIWGPLFLINIGLLVFIADQLVFKSESAMATVSSATAAPATKPTLVKTQPAATAFQIPQKTLVSFADIGVWAELKSLSQTGFELRCLEQKIPPQIENREIEMSFEKNIFIKTRFKNHQTENFYFEFDTLTSEQAQSLNT